MGTSLRLNMNLLLFVLFLLLALLVIAVVVIHAATPNLFHTIALKPNVIYRH
jgi:hypothetical protein